ncbi:hypothetical protein [Streptomyces avidinii]
MRRFSIPLIVGALLTSTIAIYGATGASGSTAPKAAATSTDSMPVAVEGFSYPGADAIFSDQGIRLKRGDGHITLAQCESQVGLLEVWSSQNDGTRFCFKVGGAAGYLTLEIPSVYGVKGSDHEVQVDMNVPGTGADVSLDVKRNEWTPVGIVVDPLKREHTLVEIRTKA